MLFVFICFILSALCVWWYKRPNGFPPGPRGLPLLGAIPFLGWRPGKKFHKWSKQYGPIMSVRMARKDWVILNSYDVIMEAMVRKGQKFAGRPPNYIVDVLFDSRNLGIIFSSGETWVKHRKLGNLMFRSHGIGKSSFESMIMDELSVFTDVIAEKSGAPYNFREDVSKSIANVICRFVFGKRFQYSDKLIQHVVDNIYTDPKKGALLNAAMLMPFLRFFPPIGCVLTELWMHREDWFESFREEIEKHKLSLDESNPRDYIDLFLIQQMLEQNQNGENLYFTDEQCLICVMNLFGAGSETSSSAVLWCILGLLNYPEFQERIQSEIDTVIGEKIPSLKHQKEMHFTQAYIQEIQRFCTLTPLAVPHYTMENVEIGGYLIPKGTNVLANLWACHNDANTFENPHEFRPERFLNSEGVFKRSPHVIPFGVGPRHCLGEPLAKIELFLFLVAILQKFTIETESSGLSDLPKMNDGILGIVYFPKPFKTVCTPRKLGH